MIKTASLTHITVHLSITNIVCIAPNIVKLLRNTKLALEHRYIPDELPFCAPDCEGTPSILNSLSTSSSSSVNPPRDCSDVYDLGHDVNGYYNVTTSNGTQLEVYCDLTTDGGRWTRIFVHDLSMGVGYWNRFGSETKDPYLWNQENPRDGMYSIIGLMDEFKGAYVVFEREAREFQSYLL